MKYFLTDSNDEVHGPYSLEEIKKRRASGEVESSALLCEEGSETWQPLASILPASPQPAQQAPPTPKPAPQAQPAAKTVPPAKPMPSVTAPPTSPRPATKPRMNLAFLICIAITLALIFFAAYYFGRRLKGV
jgi:outer membrane biosynthesis protein TonB